MIITNLLKFEGIEGAWYFNGAVYGKYKEKRMFRYLWRHRGETEKKKVMGCFRKNFLRLGFILYFLLINFRCWDTCLSGNVFRVRNRNKHYPRLTFAPYESYFFFKRVLSYCIFFLVVWKRSMKVNDMCRLIYINNGWYNQSCYCKLSRISQKVKMILIFLSQKVIPFYVYKILILHMR